MAFSPNTVSDVNFKLIYNVLYHNETYLCQKKAILNVWVDGIVHPLETCYLENNHVQICFILYLSQENLTYKKVKCHCSFLLHHTNVLMALHHNKQTKTLETKENDSSSSKTYVETCAAIISLVLPFSATITLLYYSRQIQMHIPLWAGFHNVVNDGILFG